MDFFPRVRVAIIVENEARQILLYRRMKTITYQVNYCMPGGMLESGEELSACCARELGKETGLGADRFEFEAVTETLGPPHLIGIVFRAIGVRGIARNNDPKSHDGMGWFGRHELPTPLMPGVSQWLAIEEAREGASRRDRHPADNRPPVCPLRGARTGPDDPDRRRNPDLQKFDSLIR